MKEQKKQMNGESTLTKDIIKKLENYDLLKAQLIKQNTFSKEWLLFGLCFISLAAVISALKGEFLLSILVLIIGVCLFYIYEDSRKRLKLLEKDDILNFYMEGYR